MKNRQLSKIQLKRLPFLLICLLGIFSCNQQNKQDVNIPLATNHSNAADKKATEAIAFAKKLLKDGELITRSDNDFESLILQNFSQRERKYSHSGLLYKEGNEYVVYHCMGGEENPGSACKREPFDSFVNPREKTGFGIFQYLLTDTENQRLHTILQKYVDSKIPFDASFNLKTDDSLYCSEMIWKAIKKATSDRIVLPCSFINNFKPKIMGYRYNGLFFKKFEYIGIDDLYLNPFCKPIFSIQY